MRALAIAVLLLTLAGCASKTPVIVEQELSTSVVMPPALTASGVFEVSDEEVLRYVQGLHPSRQGLGSWKDMDFAVSQSLRFTRAKPSGQVALRLGDRTVTYGHMARTLKRLKELLPRLDANPELLVTEFKWLRVGPDFRFTGYYEPTLAASPVRTERFTQPLYMTPPDYATVVRKQGKYHTRATIDKKGVLRGKGLEIAWIENPVDAVFLQIEGSGRLVFPDGSTRHALYSAQNKHRMKPLALVLRERGLLPPDGISMQAIREYLDEHPGQRSDLLNTDPSYVFFRLSNKGPFGSMGRILSPKVSVAVDQSVLPNGLTTFMSLYTPDETGKPTKPFLGLTLPQDSGGAIKKHRIDMFFGNGSEAEIGAGHLNQFGAVMVLLDRREALAALTPSKTTTPAASAAAKPNTPSDKSTYLAKSSKR